MCAEDFFGLDDIAVEGLRLRPEAVTFEMVPALAGGLVKLGDGVREFALFELYLTHVYTAQSAVRGALEPICRPILVAQHEIADAQLEGCLCGRHFSTLYSCFELTYQLKKLMKRFRACKRGFAERIQGGWVNRF